MKAETTSASFGNMDGFLQRCEMKRREEAYVRPGMRACKRAMVREIALTLAKFGVWVAVFALDSFTPLQGVMTLLALMALSRYSKAIFVSDLRQAWRAREALGTSPLWEQILAEKPHLAAVERAMDRNREATEAWRWWRLRAPATVGLTKEEEENGTV